MRAGLGGVGWVCDGLVKGGPSVSAGAADVAVPEEVALETLLWDAGGAEVVGLVVGVDGNDDGGGCHGWWVYLKDKIWW